ncbi:6-O-methylguanine DNA methyltransferase [Lactarius quietus]|nr:6-O-methylguanine DNA methyltransferase [Lactarius quietus]
MPTERIDFASFRYTPAKRPSSKTQQQICFGEVEPAAMAKANDCDPASLREATDFSKCDIYYPLTRSERDAFRIDAGKRVPPHHWAVYDLIRSIPAGKVSTYKDVCNALGSGSPRSVGGALRNNPFAPRIPCHRVIASSLFVGGFKGEWASKAPVGRKNWHRPFRGGGMGPLQDEKMRMLLCEGVRFGRDGQAAVSRDALWKFCVAEEDTDE